MSREQRKQIQTGDLLAWSSLGAGKSNFLLNLVRIMTMSDYGHVSVAWVRDGELYHVEATMPKIRVAKILPSDRFYTVPMTPRGSGGLDMSFFSDKIGMRYSVKDALRAFFGIAVEQDESYQCAELTNEFYKSRGIDLGDAFTPMRVVNAALDLDCARLIKVNPDPLPT